MKRAQFVEVGDGDALLGELRGHFPCAFAGQRGEPGAECLLRELNLRAGVARVVAVGAAQDFLFPGFDAVNLLVGEAEVDELEAVFAIGAQLHDEAGGGALRGGGGVVELVGQIAGELAESGELFSLLLDAGDFADAIEQRGDDALRHGGNGLEHLREDVSL